MKKYMCIAVVASLSACCSPQAQDYAMNKPTLDIREYFNGNLKASGAFFSRSGKADPQFTIAMKGIWNGNDGILKEHFVYNDGRIQDRRWNIHFVDDHHLTATAADVEGTATGEQYGNALNMHYVLDIPSKDNPSTTHAVTMDDWIFLLDEKTGINHVPMSKFGLNVGEIIITFSKSDNNE